MSPTVVAVVVVVGVAARAAALDLAAAIATLAGVVLGMAVLVTGVEPFVPSARKGTSTTA